MAVRYEWDVETVTDRDSAEHEKDEVLDHNHFDTFREASEFVRVFKPADGERFDLVLVRDDDNGRSWAYVTDGKLPEYFSDAYRDEVSKVPQRFHNEMTRA